MRNQSDFYYQLFFVGLLTMLFGFSVFLFLQNQQKSNTDTSVSTPINSIQCSSNLSCGSNQYCNLSNGQCVIKKTVGQICNSNAECSNSDCLGGICTVSESCTRDSDCSSNEFCSSNKCFDKRDNFSVCSRNSQCKSEFCDGSVCRP